MERDLSPEEVRVLGCLVEKEATTPEQYPLSINALVQACNQKSNRDPVLDLPEADVREAVTGLTRRGLVRQAATYGGRVSKFEHRLGRGPGSPLNATAEQLALLSLLMVRGPQTPGELRARAQRMAEFPDTETVERALAELAEHEAGPLVERLAREPGKRESRYRHCLAAAGDDASAGAAPAAAAPAAMPGTQEPAGATDSLELRVAELERAVEDLRARLDAADAGH